MYLLDGTDIIMFIVFLVVILPRGMVLLPLFLVSRVSRFMGTPVGRRELVGLLLCRLARVRRILGVNGIELRTGDVGNRILARRHCAYRSLDLTSRVTAG